MARWQVSCGGFVGWEIIMLVSLTSSLTKRLKRGDDWLTQNVLLERNDRISCFCKTTSWVKKNKACWRLHDSYFYLSKNRRKVITRWLHMDGCLSFLFWRSGSVFSTNPDQVSCIKNEETEFPKPQWRSNFNRNHNVFLHHCTKKPIATITSTLTKHLFYFKPQSVPQNIHVLPPLNKRVISVAFRLKTNPAGV